MPALPFHSSAELQELVSNLLPRFGLTLSSAQISSLATYVHMLRKWQQTVNLVSEESLQRLLRFHFLESFWMAEHFLSDQTDLTDIGTGAGFPGLAAKIYRPGLNLTLVENKPRKALFLEAVVRQLSLLKVSVFPLRWQEYRGWKPGNTVCIRALKLSPKLLERLQRHQQVLLLLHSSELSTYLDNYDIINQLQVPESRQRWATQVAFE